MLFSTVIGQFASCLRLIALRFCKCYGFKGASPMEITVTLKVE